METTDSTSFQREIYVVCLQGHDGGGYHIETNGLRHEKVNYNKSIVLFCHVFSLQKFFLTCVRVFFELDIWR